MVTCPGVEDLEATEQNQGILPPTLNGETVDTSLETVIDDAHRAGDGGTFLKYGSHGNLIHGKKLFTLAGDGGTSSLFFFSKHPTLLVDSPSQRF